MLRYEEDWSRFDPSSAPHPLETIKNVQLHDSASTLTLGGQVQALYEITQDGDWGESPERNDRVFYDRYLMHGDLRIGDQLRIFGELISGFSRGEVGRPSGDNEDRLGFQNLFLDIPWTSEKATTTLRLGRQQFAFGEGRLVSERDGASIPRTFDGVRIIRSTDNRRVDAFVSYLAEENTGTFDDGSNEDVALWGIYSMQMLESGGLLDLYYLGFRDRAGVFDQGAGHEVRHSLGIRTAYEGGRWDYELEATGQFGRFAGSDIRAWSSTIVGGYTWNERSWSPRLGIEAGVASGDDDPDDPDLETFNAMFPPDDYFSELGLLGHTNFINLQPSVSVNPLAGLTLTFDVNFYWRYSRDDGIYSPPRDLLRSGADSDARYVATHASFTAGWEINRHVRALVAYTRSFPGEVIRDTGDDENIDFLVLQVGYTF